MLATSSRCWTRKPEGPAAVSFFLKKNHNSWMRLDQRLSLRTGSGGYRGSAINGFLKKSPDRLVEL